MGDLFHAFIDFSNNTSENYCAVANTLVISHIRFL